MYNVIFYEKTKDITTTEEVIERTWIDDTNYTDNIVTNTVTKTYRVPTKFVFDTATNCDKLLKGYEIIDDVKMSMPSLNSAVSMFEGSSITTFSGNIGGPADFNSLTVADGMFENCESLISINIDASSLVNVDDFVSGCTSLESFSGDLSSLISGEDMFSSTVKLTSFNAKLDSLENGTNMFNGSPLESFNSSLSSLEIADNMFANTMITQFGGEMPSLVSANGMFINTPLIAFTSSLPLLESAYQMFAGTTFVSFSCDMPNILNAEGMFIDSSLTSFNGSLKKLKNATGMFANTSLKSFTSDSLASLEYADNMMGTPSIEKWTLEMPSLKSARNMFTSIIVDENTVYPALKEFRSDLSSLVDGEAMFRDCTSLEVFDAPLPSLRSAIDMFSGCKLNAESLMFIAETLPEKEESEARIIDIGVNTTSGEINNFITSAGIYRNYDELYERFYSKGWNLTLSYNFQAESTEG